MNDEINKLETISKEIFGNSWIVPLAEYVGVTRQAVYLWLAKKRRIPHVVMVCLKQRQKLDKIPVNQKYI